MKKKEEIEEMIAACIAFDKKLQELPHLQSVLVPASPEILDAVQDEYIQYQETPSDFSLLRLRDFGTRWDETAQTFVERIKGCEQQLDRVELSEEDKIILRRGYEAQRYMIRDIREQLRKYGNIYDAVVFAEEKLDEFDHFISSEAPHLHSRLQGVREEKGGMIFYDNAHFDIEFLPNKTLSEYERLMEEIKKGKMEALENLYHLAKPLLHKNFETNIAAFPLSELSHIVVQYGLALANLEKLREGQLTPDFESYLSLFFAAHYRFHPDGIFADDRRFSEGSSRQLFAYFHHHPTFPHAVYLDLERGPSPRDIRATWEIGPQVLFVPQDRQLDVYFISRGDSRIVGKYPV